MTAGDRAPNRLDAFFDADSVATQALFPTPLVSGRIESCAELNAELSATILGREKVEPGVVVSNQGGWHSKEFVSWCGPAGTFVLNAARRLVEHMTVMERGNGFSPANVGWCVAAWANINRAGDSNRPHGHPGSFWSGIYWVDAGDVERDPSVGGMLEIADPRGIMPSMYAPHLRCAVEACLSDGQGRIVMPQAGTMILFPSWLVHSVSPYAGPRARISVAFNFSLGQFPTVLHS